MNLSEPNLTVLSRTEIEDEILRLRTMLFEQEAEEGQVPLVKCQNFTLLEFALVKVLWSKRGTVLSRDFLIDHCYPPNTYTTDRSIDAHIKKLRKKFRSLGIKTRIQTKWGFGYFIDSEDHAPFELLNQSLKVTQQEPEWNEHLLKMLKRKAASSRQAARRRTESVCS